MKLSSRDFNNHLRAMGQNVAWRRANACPCVNPSSGQPKPTCRHCEGLGRVWQPAVTGRTGVVGGNAQNEWLQTGLADTGDVILSIPSDSPLYAIGSFDRVLFLNRSEPFSQNIVKGVNERIRFHVLAIERVLYEQDSQLVDGPLPAVRENGTVDWSGVEVPDGVTFSVTGRRRAEFFSLPKTPFDRPHHAGAQLPRRVVLRRFDLYGATSQ